MKNTSIKTIAIVALGLAGALAGGSAMARDRDDVRWSVTVGSPGVYVGASSGYYPGYYRPAPVYVQPAPVYYEAPGYYHRDRHHHHHRHGHGYQEPRRWDVDGDGIPNRYDNRYNPRWDRDGDGIPNRYDRYPGRGR